MKKNKFVYVLRVNKKEGNIEIFHVDEWLNLVCWAKVGEHCEASRAYYLNDTQPIPNERQEEANRLFERYMSSYPTSEDIIEVRGKYLKAPTFNLVFKTDENEAFYLSKKKEFRDKFVIKKKDGSPVRDPKDSTVCVYNNEIEAFEDLRDERGENIVSCSTITNPHIICEIAKKIGL